MNRRIIMSEQTIKTNTACLNTVKFFGACIVAFVWHYQHFEPNGSPFSSVFRFSYPYGWLMVELFFMLSGFGMMLGYGSKIIRHEISFPKYIRKRLNAMYPLFFITLVLVTVLEILYHRKNGTTFVYPNFDVYHFFLNLILCQDGLLGKEWSFNSPSWCISICMILYVIFYIVLYRSKDTRIAVYRFAGLGILGAMLLMLGWDYPVLNSLVARGLLCFSLGVALAFFHQNEHRFHTRMIGTLCFIALAALYVLYRKKPNIMGNMHMLFILCIAPMVILAVLYVPWLNRILSHRFFAFFGSLSLEIYLFHFIVQCLIVNLDTYCHLGLDYSRKIVWIGYAVSTILVSILYKQLFAVKCKTLFVKVCDKFLLK